MTTASAISRISNPVLRGTQPDPSVIRVGEDYYLATSSFDLMPGIQIRHSTDLVDWRLIGGAVTRPAQYRRDGLPGPINLFASTLRHHDGEFFLVSTNVADNQGNFLLRTRDPRTGWSDATWLDRDAFDPSLLFDDGHVYYSRRSMDRLADGRLGPVVQAELDLDSGALGPFRELTPDHGGFCSNDIEGPHVYRIGDQYYLFSAEGGSWSGHMQTVARSSSPWGPFEPAPHNPVLTHRHRVGHPIQTLGHAELVDAVDGSWWALALGTRHEGRGGFALHHNLGRETFLAPVEWVDGWPVIGIAGTIELDIELDRSLPGAPRTAPPRDELFESGWRSIGTIGPVPRAQGSGTVHVAFGQGLDQDDDGLPVGALLVAQTEDAQRFTAEIAVPLPGSAVGVGVHADRRHHYAAQLETSPSGGRSVRFTRRVDDLLVVTEHPIGAAGPYELSIVAGEDRYDFRLRTADGDEPIGSGSARLLSAEAAEWFIGASFALLAVGPVDAPPAVFEHVDRTDLVTDDAAHSIDAAVLGSF